MVPFPMPYDKSPIQATATKKISPSPNHPPEQNLHYNMLAE